MFKTIPNLNRAPLEALLRNLKETPNNLPKLDMRYLAGYENGEKVIYPSQVTECCTSLCLVGRLPLLGFPALENETWIEYSCRVIGEIASPVWQYLFNHNHSDSISAAILRIENVLAGRKDLSGIYYNNYLERL